MKRLLLTTAACLLGAASASAAQAAGYEAQVVRTKYGIPHVTAKDFGGLGFGQA